MEWLQLGPDNAWSFAFIIWFFGAVAGYCFGRLHAVWIELGKLSDHISKTVERLDKGNK